MERPTSFWEHARWTGRLRLGGIEWGNRHHGQRIMLPSEINFPPVPYTLILGQKITWDPERAGCFCQLGKILWQIPEPTAGTIDSRLGERRKMGVMLMPALITTMYALDTRTKDPLELRPRRLSNRRPPIDRGRQPSNGIVLPKYSPWNRETSKVYAFSP